MKRTLAIIMALATGMLAIMARAEQTEQLPGLPAQPASYFYTGKPYDADLGAYVFAYRGYDPEMNRWTTADPSGFPDGSNPLKYVSNNPLSLFDDTGLKGKSIAWVYWQGSFNDASSITLLNFSLTTVASMMDSADRQKPSPKYVNDGDKLHPTVLVASSIQQITDALNSFERIALFSHGWYNGKDYYWGVANPPYHSPSEIGEKFANVYYASCYDAYSPRPVLNAKTENAFGSLNMKMRELTMEYLKE